MRPYHMTLWAGKDRLAEWRLQRGAMHEGVGAMHEGVGAMHEGVGAMHEGVGAMHVGAGATHAHPMRKAGWTRIGQNGWISCAALDTDQMSGSRGAGGERGGEARPIKPAPFTIGSGVGRRTARHDTWLPRRVGRGLTNHRPDPLKSARFGVGDLYARAPLASEDEPPSDARAQRSLVVTQVTMAIGLSPPSHAAVASNELLALTALGAHLASFGCAVRSMARGLQPSAEPPRSASGSVGAEHHAAPTLLLAASGCASVGGGHAPLAWPPPTAKGGPCARGGARGEAGGGGSDMGGGFLGPGGGGASLGGGGGSDGSCNSGARSCPACPCTHFAPLLDHFEHAGWRGRRLLVLCMENLGDSLATHLQRQRQPLRKSGVARPAAPPSAPLCARRVCRHLLRALRELHDGAHIAHCDVHPGNVLARAHCTPRNAAVAATAPPASTSGLPARRTGEQPIWCLVDFGMARPLPCSELLAGGKTLDRGNDGNCGNDCTALPQRWDRPHLPMYRTLPYCSPEALLELPDSPGEVDIDPSIGICPSMAAGVSAIGLVVLRTSG
eukprot:151317-Chlamydomonas_euryale.AAC.16